MFTHYRTGRGYYLGNNPPLEPAVLSQPLFRDVRRSPPSSIADHRLLHASRSGEVSPPRARKIPLQRALSPWKLPHLTTMGWPMAKNVTKPPLRLGTSFHQDDIGNEVLIWLFVDVPRSIRMNSGRIYLGNGAELSLGVHFMVRVDDQVVGIANKRCPDVSPLASRIRACDSMRSRDLTRNRMRNSKHFSYQGI